MLQKIALPVSRVDARIPLAMRETIDRAAAMQGHSHRFSCGGAGKGGAGYCRAIACASCAGRSASPCRRATVGRNGSPVVFP